MPRDIKTTPEIVEVYWQLFVNRRAYTMQSLRPHPEEPAQELFNVRVHGAACTVMRVVLPTKGDVIAIRREKE